MTSRSPLHQRPHPLRHRRHLLPLAGQRLLLRNHLHPERLRIPQSSDHHTGQGLLFFTDRTIPAGQAPFTLHNWNSAIRADGIFYLPSQPLIISNINFKPAAYLGVVCDYLRLNNTTFNTATDYSSLARGNPSIP